MNEYLKRFQRDVLPKMANSTAAIAVVSATLPDPKICLEVGAAIMLDKPIIVVAEPGRDIPKVLAKIATAIIVGDLSQPEMRDRLEAAIRDVLKVAAKQ